MKKKTMQTLFVLLFIAGLIVGYLLPGDIRALTKKPLQAGIFDVPKKFGQLEMETPYFKYTVLSETDSGSVLLLRIDGAIPQHMFKENSFIYVFKGRVKKIIGDVAAEAGPGQLIVIPAGVVHSLERVGDTPVEAILFSTPPFTVGDIVYSEK